jgi:exodeoxyribonuclease-3
MRDQRDVLRTRLYLAGTVINAAEGLDAPNVDDCARLVKQGWSNGLRSLHPGERIYTFWHYMRHRFARDASLRLHHVLLSPALAKQLKAARAITRRRG